MKKEQHLPPQHQSSQPNIESKMHPEPQYLDPEYCGSNKLKNKVAMMKRASEPCEIAPCYVFLASKDVKTNTSS